MRSLSTDHRLANPSQISIASRTSIRHSTPRESNLFTKIDVPIVVQLLQQAPYQDSIQTINDRHRCLQNQEHIQTPIIIEEDISLSLSAISNANIKSSITIKKSNGFKNWY